MRVVDECGTARLINHNYGDRPKLSLMTESLNYHNSENSIDLLTHSDMMLAYKRHSVCLSMKVIYYVTLSSEISSHLLSRPAFLYLISAFSDALIKLNSDIRTT